MYEIESTLFAGASIVNSPSVFVAVPIVVPFTKTLAPMIGSPLASRTTPEILCFSGIYCSRSLIATAFFVQNSQLFPLPQEQGLIQ